MKTIFPKVFESVSDLSAPQIQSLLERAKELKGRLKSRDYVGLPSLSQRLICTQIEENSTRTKYSFQRAIQNLGCQFLDIDTKTSSLEKGESLQDHFQTLKMIGAEMVIVRSSQTGFFKPFKTSSPLAMINAGDGVGEHPTQALLDLFTLTESQEMLKGKTLTFFGDCLHSRVFHSLAPLLAAQGMNIRMCGPEVFVGKEGQNQDGVSVSHDFEKSLSETDITYFLRVQKERHKGDLFNGENYHREYGLTEQRYQKYCSNKPILHPGPANAGVELAQSVMNHKNYLAASQVAHGVPMRMAVIEAILLSQKEM